jgi:phosphate transport system substrate-binding protein
MRTIFSSKSSRPGTNHLHQFIGLLVIGALLSSCADKNQPPETVSQGKIIIKGSNTIGEELAPRLIAAFKKDHPSAVFELESKGTGYGLAALMAQQCDIAGASRAPIKDELESAKSRGIELNDYVIGSYSVAVVVNAANPLANLTREQVRDVFTGAVQNWKDIGGPDAAVHLYIRDPVSGTYLGFRELAMENKPYASGPKTFTNYSAIVQAVAQDPGGIGYVSIDLAQKPGIKAVSIGGVVPVAAAINEGKYPFARVLRFYTQKAKEPAAAQDFVRFVQSSPGQDVVTEMGFVRRP